MRILLTISRHTLPSNALHAHIAPRASAAQRHRQYRPCTATDVIPARYKTFTHPFRIHFVPCCHCTAPYDLPIAFPPKHPQSSLHSTLHRTLTLPILLPVLHKHGEIHARGRTPSHISLLVRCTHATTASSHSHPTAAAPSSNTPPLPIPTPHPSYASQRITGRTSPNTPPPSQGCWSTTTGTPLQRPHTPWPCAWTTLNTHV